MQEDQEKEEIICNRFEGYQFGDRTEWVSIHDELIHFPGWNPILPTIKLCGRTIRIRANDAWTRLPRDIKDSMCAHEVGHRELEHYLKANLLFRVQSLINQTPPLDEIAADRYACKLIPKKKMYRCLNFLMDRSESINIKMEYTYRIRALGDI